MLPFLVRAISDDPFDVLLLGHEQLRMREFPRLSSHLLGEIVRVQRIQGIVHEDKLSPLLIIKIYLAIIHRLLVTNRADNMLHQIS